MEGLTAQSPLQKPDCSPEMLARALRHEMGDFLQKIYAVVAILTDRLSGGWEQETALLASLRVRAEQCRNMLDNVQDFLCPMVVDERNVDLRAVTGEAVAAVSARFPQMSIALACGAPVTARGDPDYLVRLATILLTNACESARSHVGIELTTDERARDAIWTIVDDGPGLEPRIVPRLFMPFSTTRAGHVGLGLAVARKIVDQVGGDIAVTNQPGSGARVRVTIPSPRAAARPSSPASSREPRHDTC